MSERLDMDAVGAAVHYTTVQRGTAVYDSDGERVGSVREIHDNYREHILDGIELEDREGRIRFVDGPEVARTFERAVLLSIRADEIAGLDPPKPSGPLGRLGRLLGGS